MSEEKKVDPKIEALLTEFLQTENEARKKGLTIESLHTAMQHLSDNFDSRFTAHEKLDESRFTELRLGMDRVVARQNRHGAKLSEIRSGVKKVEGEVKDLDEAVEETGRYELDQLRDSRKHWTRWIPMTIAGFVLMVMGSTIAVLIAKTVGK